MCACVCVPRSVYFEEVCESGKQSWDTAEGCCATSGPLSVIPKKIQTLFSLSFTLPVRHSRVYVSPDKAAVKPQPQAGQDPSRIVTGPRQSLPVPVRPPAQRGPRGDRQQGHRVSAPFSHPCIPSCGGRAAKRAWTAEIRHEQL